MATFILDTGILVGYIRGAGYAEYVEKRFEVSTPPNISVISVVTVGEIHSFAIQKGWGEKKKEQLRELLNKIPAADINDPKIIERYAEIDAYSQGKFPSRQLPQGMSSRNMNKNDLWIAATASVLNATLLTIDKDFEHLNNVFLKVIYIDQALKAEDATPSRGEMLEFTDE